MLGRSILTMGLLAMSLRIAVGWCEHWEASSHAASAITGDLTVTAREIVFGSGRSLPIRKLRSLSFTDDAGRIGPATLYRVTRPGDPLMLHGNTFCRSPVTFVVLWRTTPVMSWEREGRALAAYAGPGEPAPDASAACALFRYDLPT